MSAALPVDDGFDGLDDDGASLDADLDAPQRPSLHLRRGEADTYLDILFGDREGYVAGAFGFGPRRSPKGTYEHRKWRPWSYRWPVDRRHLLADVTERLTAADDGTGPLVDVYVCDHLRRSPQRHEHDALPPVALHADLDGPPADVDLYAALEPLRVSSGSHGHEHAAVLLAEPLDDLARWSQLQKALRDRLGGGADAKIADNDVLRLPGTINCKPAAPRPGEPAGDPTAVTLLPGWTGRVWPLDELAALLGVDLSTPPPPLRTRRAGPVEVPATVPVPADLPERVRAAADGFADAPDKSGQWARLIGCAASAGLTRDQAFAVAAAYGLPHLPRYAGREVAEFERFWAKSEEWRAERAAARAGAQDGRQHPPKPAGSRTPRPLAPARAGGRDAPSGPRPVATTQPRDPEESGSETEEEASDRFATLPEEFWSARPVLGHIRQAAWSRNRSGDVWFNTLLARSSAIRSHHIAADTGVGSPASLNVEVLVIGRSGAGKTSGMPGAKRLMPAPPGLDFLDGAPLGSGEGIAEAFMGERHIPGEKGKRARTDRVQVRHNALLVLDEGQTLTKMWERSGAIVGATLRTAFSGEILGQLNARKETTRLVRDYSLGIVIGFQPSTVLPLLDDAAAGTPQRFLFVSATDPAIPREQVDDPGPLPLDWSAFMASEPTSLTFARAVREEIYTADWANAAGLVTPPELDSHKAVMRVKVASLLALLDGRREVTEEDWALSLMVWDTSAAVRDRLVAMRDELAATREWTRRRAFVVDQVEAAVAVEDRQVSRVASWVSSRVHEAKEPPRASVLRKSLASRDRQVFETAMDYAVAQRWVRRDDDGVLHKGASRPADGAS